MINIFLTDDHEMVRQGIKALLEREADLQVISEAGNGRETLSKLAEFSPDLLVLDLMLPDMSGLDVLENAKKTMPGLLVIVLSMYDNKVYLMESLQRGADGYVIKGSSGADLLKAIRTVSSGRRYVSPPLAEYLMDTVSPKKLKTGSDSFVKLTSREDQVLYFTADGLSSSQIAEKLGISARTVETHRNNLMKKLGLHNKAELIRYSIEHGRAQKQ